MFKQKGLSLVELMIAITIGSVLLLGVMQVFLSSKKVYSSQQSLSRVQETGRLAIDFLARDIRMAGYFGCASRASDLTVTNTLKSATDIGFDFSTAIKGYTSTTFPTVTFTPVPTLGDVIVIRGASGNGVEVVQNNDSAKVFVKDTGTEANACSPSGSRTSGFCIGDILVVSDCAKSRVFQATDITSSGGMVNLFHSGAAATPGNLTAVWGGSAINVKENFLPGAQVLSATSTVYYIATGTGGRPSLYQSINGANGVELLEGVDNMSIKYGFADGTYSTAATVNTANTWSTVISVRVELLVSSVEDRVTQDKQTYYFNGAPVTATDNRLRQVFQLPLACAVVSIKVNVK